MRPLNYAKIIKYNPDKTVLRYFPKANIEKMIRDAKMTLEKNSIFGNLPPYIKNGIILGYFKILERGFLP